MTTGTPEIRAEEMGGRVAEAEMQFGAAEPRDSPLSGEWVDELTAHDLFIRIMGRRPMTAADLDLMESIGDSFEAGYEARWNGGDDA